MKTKRHLRAFFSIIFLIVFVFSGTVMAAPQMKGTENHYDTRDYCIRIYDVTLHASTVSEQQGNLDQFAKENFVRELLLRDSGLIDPVDEATVSYDLSGVGTEPGTYYAYLDLPALTPGEDERFQFTVTVEADPTYEVSYSFVSGTGSMSLPTEVLALLPETQYVASGTTITPSGFSDIKVNGGIWRFAGWDLKSQVIGTDDVMFYGTWTFTKDVQPSVKPGDTKSPVIDANGGDAGTPASNQSVPRSATRPMTGSVTNSSQAVPVNLPSEETDQETATKTEETREDIASQTEKAETSATSNTSSAASTVVGSSIEQEDGNRFDINGLLIAVIAVLAAASAVLSVDVLRSFRVLNWYQEQKKRVLRGRK